MRRHNLKIAITYNSLDDDQKAEQSYLKAIALAKKLNLKNVLTYAYSNIASLYEGMKKYDKQYDFAMKAAVLGNEMGDKGISASSLSRAAGALAEENKFQDAEKLNRQAMATADSSNQPYNIYQIYGTMGFILKLQQRYREAIPYFEKAFRSLTESDIYTEEVGKHYADLSECYEKTGNFNKALFAYKTATQISDSIRGRDNVKKATELSMNYDFETKQQVEKAEQQKKRCCFKNQANCP